MARNVEITVPFATLSDLDKHRQLDFHVDIFSTLIAFLKFLINGGYLHA